MSSLSTTFCPTFAAMAEMDEAQWKYACECLEVFCKKCGMYARDQIGVHWDLVLHDCVVTTDSVTRKKWTSCDSCNHFYHLRCITNLSEEIISQSRFYCPAEKCLKKW